MLSEGKNLCITPDGPRGPRYKMSKGPILLAGKTGVPVLPITINTESYWELRTWDKFRIPRPWAKVYLKMGTPIAVPPDLDDEGVETYRKKVESALLEISGDSED